MEGVGSEGRDVGPVVRRAGTRGCGHSNSRASGLHRDIRHRQRLSTVQGGGRQGGE